MPNAKFFNCVDFDVNFRMIWLPNNPAVKLKPGQIIEGPFELLMTYNFLRPLQQQNINPINTPTQDEKGNYLDEEVQKDVEEKEQLAEKHAKSFASDAQPREDEETPVNVVDDWQNLELPFDPTNCNWIKVKQADLEEAAKILGIGVDESVPPKKRKWDLVRKVKAAIGKN